MPLEGLEPPTLAPKAKAISNFTTGAIAKIKSEKQLINSNSKIEKNQLLSNNINELINLWTSLNLFLKKF